MAHSRSTASCASARPLSLLALVLASLGACVSPTARIESIAEASGLQALELHGGGFHLRSFNRIEAAQTRLIVFIDGDGSPWVDHGTRVATDPTPHNPLALRLAALTPGSVLYLGRPCYLGHARDAECAPQLWTAGRYSVSVVSSMVAALNDFVAMRGFRTVTLVGHSGGGALAVLMAPQLDAITQVVTIAANLDVAAWVQVHGYLPLDTSLDPADQAPLGPRIQELHLVGARDVDVPPATASRYLTRLDPSRIVTFEDYDHVCCWERDWKRIWVDVERRLDR